MIPDTPEGRKMAETASQIVKKMRELKQTPQSLSKISGIPSLTIGKIINCLNPSKKDVEKLKKFLGL